MPLSPGRAMRFAYIDSQGNEVTIPSVDALALRIELGAIGPDTELYDAQADRWGPAHTHEIFHTLSRDAGGDTFLVPSPPRAEEPETIEPGGQAAEEEAADSGARAPGVPPVFDAATLGLTLSPAAPSAGTGGTAPDKADPPPPAGPPATADPPAAAEPPPTADPRPDPAAPEARLEEPIFDLVDDLAGEVPTSGAGRPPEDDPSLPRQDGGSGVEHEPPIAFDGGFSDGGFELEPTMDFAGPVDPIDSEPLELEPTMEFAAPAGEDESDRLDLEPPMSAFDPSGPPAWMEQDGPEGDEAAMDFSRPDVGPDAEEGPLPASEAEPVTVGLDSIGPAAPRRRPTPPRRPVRRRGGGGRWLFSVAALGLLATGGYYGWRAFGDRLRPPPPRPAVVIPAIPAELEAPMRVLADRALPAMYADIESAVMGAVPEEPSPDWLAGVYLGNASSFAEVEVFWNGIAAFAERLGALEVETFRAEYAALADSAGFDGAERALMVARADSGFLATREERLGSYRLLGRLADASLSLHGFLVENESSIAYTPATAFSGNPVEEAVPATEELGDRMWDLVEDITNALDALGTLDRVTRERLSTVLFERISAIGIR